MEDRESWKIRGTFDPFFFVASRRVVVRLYMNDVLGKGQCIGRNKRGKNGGPMRENGRMSMTVCANEV